MKIKKLQMKCKDGRTTEAVIKSPVCQVLTVETWDGENTSIITLMAGQNGQVDISLVLSSVDNPIKHHLFWYNHRAVPMVGDPTGRTRVRDSSYGNPEALYEEAIKQVAEKISNGYFTDEAYEKLTTVIAKELRPYG